jgi:hypothetical protein
VQDGKGPGHGEDVLAGRICRLLGTSSGDFHGNAAGTGTGAHSR